MITYDSRNWFKALALHRSDTFRKLVPLLLVVGAFTAVVGYVEVKYLQLSAPTRPTTAGGKAASSGANW
jgi:ion channel-forming bestrophin family protein